MSSNVLQPSGNQAEVPRGRVVRPVCSVCGSAGKHCRTCHHFDREAIEALCFRGDSVVLVAERYGLKKTSLYDHLDRCVRGAMEKARKALEHMREWRALVAGASLSGYEGRALMLSIRSEQAQEYGNALRGTELAASIHHRRVGLDAPPPQAIVEGESSAPRVELYIPANGRDREGDR